MVRAAALLVATCLVAAPAVATTIPPLSPQALVDKSDIVAKVTVRAHDSAWVGRRILTFYDVDVVETWRAPNAPAKSHLVIALPGGVVDGIGQLVPGTPTLTDGATYVVCLGHPLAPREGRAIIGLWQGLWAVDAAGAVASFHHDAPVAPVVDDGAPVDALRARLGIAP